jgi:hypothetical protein
VLTPSFLPLTVSHNYNIGTTLVQHWYNIGTMSALAPYLFLPSKRILVQCQHWHLTTSSPASAITQTVLVNVLPIWVVRLRGRHSKKIGPCGTGLVLALFSCGATVVGKQAAFHTGGATAPTPSSLSEDSVAKVLSVEPLFVAAEEAPCGGD